MRGRLFPPWKYRMVSGRKPWMYGHPIYFQAPYPSLLSHSNLSKLLPKCSYQFFIILKLLLQVSVASFFGCTCVSRLQRNYLLCDLILWQVRKIIDFQFVHLFLVRRKMTNSKALHIITKEPTYPLPKMKACSMFVWAWNSGHWQHQDLKIARHWGGDMGSGFTGHFLKMHLFLVKFHFRSFEEDFQREHLSKKRSAVLFVTAKMGN